MRLKRGYEQHLRQRLKRFGRWAWLAQKRNITPLNRLFSELAGGKDIEKVREQINALAIEPEIREQALRLVARYRPADYLDDGHAMRIDAAIAFILANIYPGYKKFLNDLVHMLYIEQGGTSMLKISRMLVNGTTSDAEPDDPAERERFREAVTLCYRRLRRIREQLETDIFYALEHLAHLTGEFNREATYAALQEYKRRYFDNGEVHADELDVKTRILLPSTPARYLSKVM